MMGMAYLVSICIETLKTDSGYILEKEFIEFIFMNPLMVLLLDLISLSGHSYVLLWISYHYNPIK